MAEDGILGHSPGHAALEGIHIVDALSYIDAFAEKILVHIGLRARVQIHTRISCKQPRKEGAVGADGANLHSWLEYGIAADDSVALCIELGLVQGMVQRTDELHRSVPGERGILIQRNYVSDSGEHRQFSLLRYIARWRGASKEAIEIHEFATFALPAHPTLLAAIPPALTMEQVERASGIR